MTTDTKRPATDHEARGQEPFDRPDPRALAGLETLVAAVQRQFPGTLPRDGHNSTAGWIKDADRNALRVLRNVLVVPWGRVYQLHTPVPILYQSDPNDHPPLALQVGSLCVPRAALCAQRWGSTYYHWICDGLPRVLRALAARGDWPLLGYFPPFAIDTLALLGVSQLRLLPLTDDERDPTSLYQVDELLLTPYVSCGRPAREELLSVRRALRLALASSSSSCASSPTNARHIVVVRRGGSRRLTNHDEVVAAIRQSLPGEVVCEFGEGVSMRATLELFAGARAVVGVHGSGLANLVFAPDDAPLVELLSPGYANPCFWHLAAALGHPHWWVEAADASHSEHLPAMHRDVTVSPADVVATLLRALGCSPVSASIL